MIECIVLLVLIIYSILIKRRVLLSRAREKVFVVMCVLIYVVCLLVYIVLLMWVVYIVLCVCVIVIVLIVVLLCV